MKRRKHRVVVEVTYSQPVSEKEAIYNLQEAIEHLANPRWHPVKSTYINKLSAKSFRRVRQALVNGWPTKDGTITCGVPR